MAGSLLDTHTLLWSVGDPGRLSAAVAAILRSSSSTAYVSVVSLWEIAIKEGRGSLELSPSARRLFEEGGLADYGFVLLPVEVEHLNELRRLPSSATTHGDPFDRMLAAQARAEGFELLSADTKLDAYGVRRVW